jgi:hypothetical protein
MCQFVYVSLRVLVCVCMRVLVCECVVLFAMTLLDCLSKAVGVAVGGTFLFFLSFGSFLRL